DYYCSLYVGSGISVF
nr:immunoglobulin light chain junction region [Macaca mulatta]MOY16943.1 immunoglobulin light chain junction region [Macaca mulatta]MOY17008.1 immunoglobulin light chain junction region [Macaca mulatta]MOY17460.1 immunoglobulin light chain junction region [Macaca mulatta]MOY17770.1 immunoglobulin light chain junction region [Macaca mulatta]